MSTPEKPADKPAEPVGDIQAAQTVQTEAADAVKPAKEQEDRRFVSERFDDEWEQRHAGPSLGSWGTALEVLGREILRDHGLLLVSRRDSRGTYLMVGLDGAGVWDEMMQRPLKTRMLSVRDRPVVREDAISLSGDSRAALAHMVIDETTRLAADIASKGPHRCEVRAYIRKPRKGTSSYRGILSIFKVALPDRKKWRKDAPPGMWEAYDESSNYSDDEA